MQNKEERKRTFPKCRVGGYARGMTALGRLRRRSAAFGDTRRRSVAQLHPPDPSVPRTLSECEDTFRVSLSLRRFSTWPRGRFLEIYDRYRDAHVVPSVGVTAACFGECREWIRYRYSGENPTNAWEKGRRKRERERVRERKRAGRPECGSWSISQCVPSRCFLSAASRSLLCHRPRVPADRSDSRNSQGTQEPSPRCCRRHLTSSRLRWTR